MFFSDLRITPFEPTFQWVKTTEEAAELINKPHEDYPRYVVRTKLVLDGLNIYTPMFTPISNLLLQDVHLGVFWDKPFRSKFRGDDVTVGIHVPPSFRKIQDLMDELESRYKTIKFGYSRLDLIEWYKDFETIHPFQDGNGRVGGIIVAAFSNKLFPEKGWLAPNQ